MSGKKNSCLVTDENGRIIVSKTVAVVIAVIFIGVSVAVGLLVYNYAEPGSDVKPVDGQLTASGGVRRPTEAAPPISHLKDVRLPTHLEPVLYDVQLLPHVDETKDWMIEGYVKIYMACKVAGGRNVTVHINQIDIDESSLTVQNVDTGEVIAINGVGYDKERQFFRVDLAKELEVGNQYSLEIRSFTATLNDQLAGFYRSKYGHRGQTRYMGVTQFQATDARRAFPCFDEPGMKSMFNVTLGRLVADNWTTHSNMDLINTVDIKGRPGYVWDKYNTSVKMSTYLVAFVVSQFESVRSEKSNNFKVWARPDMIDRTQLAADEGAKILAFFERYFEIKYPLPKTDMFALTDFSAGAMENWGLVTYREEYLLNDKTGKTSSANLLQAIISVIAHELSHQWFGNLVTPTWWTDLWLNEGFASYVGYLGSMEARPKWKWMQMFIVSKLQDVMRIDSLESSHPIYQEVYNPDQIREIFDRISYGKGASIIRMMNHFLTEKSFKRGLINYLNAKKFSNAETRDLWNFLNEAAHQDDSIPDDMTVNAIMGTWTELTGYPVVTLTRSTTENTATLTQTRFLLQDSAKQSAAEQGKWFVPINFNHDIADFTKTQASHWLTPTGDLQLGSRDLPGGVQSWIPNERNNNWVVVNAQETGYYRVNYDALNWKMILKQLEMDHTKIPTENRAQILDDAFNLARAGILGYETALSLTTYLAKETEYIPWRATVNAFSYIGSMLERSSGYGSFREYMRCLTKNQLTKFQLLEEIDPTYTDDVTYLFKDILIQGTACRYGVPECTGNATKLFAEWKDTYLVTNSDPDYPTISPNVKSIVYCYGVKNGGTEEWEHAWAHYSKSNLASEKSAMLHALACTKEVWLLSRYLETTFDKNTSSIRTQDAARAFGTIAGSVAGRSLAFDFLINNFARIRADFSSGISAMNRFISPFSSFNTESEAARMRRFRDEHAHELGSGTRAVEQTIESIDINTQWMKKYEKAVITWFQAQPKCS